MILLAGLLIQLSCNLKYDKTENDDKSISGSETNTGIKKDKLIPTLDISAINGKWNLKYADNYGYSFRFYRNYKSLIILYLKQSAIVFKGVYTFVDKSRVRINIFAMKHENIASRINFNKGFIKTKQSYFIFKGILQNNSKKKILILKPQKIIIDGSSSDGYFEPTIKLEKSGILFI